jgi:ubiquinone biosynthesis protein UbiJ
LILDLTYAALEKVVNRALQLDLDSQRRLATLSNKVVDIEISDWQCHAYLVFHAHNLEIKKSWQGPTDTTLSATLPSFIKIALAGGNSSSAFANQLKLSGSTTTAEQLMLLFNALDIDWEEQISQLTGDAVAQQIGKRGRQFIQLIKDSRKSLAGSTTEYLQNDSDLLPSQEEVEHFAVGVTACRHQVERLDARITRLEKAIKTRNKSL